MHGVISAKEDIISAFECTGRLPISSFSESIA